MVHLLHVFPAFGFGGTEVRVARIMNRLGEEFRHSIISLNGKIDAEELLDDRIRAEIHLGPPKSSFPNYLQALRQLIRRIEPDTVLTYNWGAIEAGLATKLAPGSLRWIHNECGLGLDESIRPHLRRVWARRFLLPLADRTITVSNDLFQQALNVYWAPAKRLILIPNGVDTEDYRPGDKTAARRALNLPDSRLLVGYIGMLRPEKRPAFLLDAFSRLETCTDVSLAIAGDGPLIEALKREAAERGIGSRVHFLGRKNNTQIVYQALDVYALSSANEGTPNGLLEAMSSGLPCVATAVGACPEVLGSDNPGLTDRDSVTNFARALDRFLQSPKLREETGARNRIRVKERFSSSQMIEAYDRVFKGLS